MEIKVLAFNRNIYMAGLNQLTGFQPPNDNLISTDTNN